MTALSIGNGLSVGYGLSASTALSRGSGFYFDGFNAAFSPASLFAAGEPGAWYDPSDMTTLFQDSAGTTPVTAVEQPVGLMLDKSKGLVLGPELVTNGDFSNGTTGWAGFTANTAISDDSGTLKQQILAGLSAAARPDVGFATVVGRTYKLSYDVVEVGSGASSVKAYVGTASGGTANGVSGIARNIPGTVTAYFVATATTYFLTTEHIGTAGTFSRFDNISVKELAGNHAFQSTSASRPVLSARYNLLTKTEEFNNAAWVSAGTIARSATADPLGGLTAWTLTAGSVDPLVYQGTTIGTKVFRIVAKAGSSNTLRFEDSAAGNGAYVDFNLAAGVAGSPVTLGSGGATISGQSINSIGSGWYECSYTVSRTNVGSNFVLRVIGSSGASIIVWHPDARVSNDGVGLPAYQRVNTAADYDTTGFPMYLKFDGVDDAMLTSSINFTATDKVSVFAGARKLSDSETIVYELSANVGANAGSFFCVQGNANGVDGIRNGWSSGARGTSALTGSQVAQSYTFASPDTAVLSSAHDIVGDLSTIRRNQIAGASATGDKGSGNFGNYPLYVGARGGTAFRANCRIYSLIVRGALSDEIQITNTETWVNARTKAFAS